MYWSSIQRKCLLLSVGIAFVIVGCSSNDIVEPVPVPALATQVDTGPIAVPLTVFTGVGEAPVTDSGGQNVPAPEDGMVGVGAQDPSGRVIYLSVVDAASSPMVELNAANTVRSLVQLSPFWRPESPAEYDHLLTLLESFPEFSTAVADYGALLRSGGALDIESAQGSTFMVSLVDLLQSVEAGLRSELMQPGKRNTASRSGPYHGVAVDLVAQGDADATIVVTNNRRRWLSVWGAAEGEDLQQLTLLRSPNVSVLSAVIALFQSESVIEVRTTELVVPQSGATTLDLSIYGLGLSGIDSDVEWSRVIEPALFGVTFDVLGEVFRLATGSPIEMRGRPRNHPLARIVDLTAVRCAARAQDFAAALRSQDAPATFTILFQCLFEAAEADPRAFADVLIDYAASVGVQGLSRSILKQYLGPLQLVNYATSLGNLAWAAASIIASPPQVNIQVPLAGSAVTNNALLGGRVVDAGSGRPILGADITISYMFRAVGSARSVSDGLFEVMVPEGSVTVAITAPGYFVHTEPVRTSAAASNSLGEVALVAVDREPGSIGGRVIDAQLGAPVADVRVVARVPGSPDYGNLETVTSSGGRYSFDDVRAGPHILAFTKSGYIGVEIPVAVVGGRSTALSDVSMSRKLGSGAYRIVLSWGATPRDLDAHLVVRASDGSQDEIMWNRPGSETSWPYAWLDRDDRTAFGPETISIVSSQGGTYSYAIHKYSSSGTLPSSSATVELYGHTGLVRTWEVPSTGSGSWWHVFDLDTSSGAVVSVNTISDTAPDGMSRSKATKPTK